MNDLERFFHRHDGRLVHKWHHYFEIYDRHFARFRNKPITVVEFGVSQGGSIQMWKHYFGDQLQFVGVDINPNCKQFEEPGVRIEIGDQQDRKFLRALSKTLPPIDVLIDDGGHTMEQQIATFEELFPMVAPEGQAVQRSAIGARRSLASSRCRRGTAQTSRAGTCARATRRRQFSPRPRALPSLRHE